MKGLYRSPAVVVILALVTCGIYALYWIYTMTSELNSYLEKREDNAGLETFLCVITCGLYTIYWAYKYAQRASEAKMRAGLPPEDNAILCLILTIFGFFIVSMALIQDTANKAWEASA